MGGAGGATVLVGVGAVWGGGTAAGCAATVALTEAEPSATAEPAAEAAAGGVLLDDAEAPLATSAASGSVGAGEPA